MTQQGIKAAVFRIHYKPGLATITRTLRLGFLDEAPHVKGDMEIEGILSLRMVLDVLHPLPQGLMASAISNVAASSAVPG